MTGLTDSQRMMLVRQRCLYNQLRHSDLLLILSLLKKREPAPRTKVEPDKAIFGNNVQVHLHWERKEGFQNV